MALQLSMLLRRLVGVAYFFSIAVLAAPEAGIPLPENGAVRRFVQGEPAAPLRIVATGESSHYLVRLVAAKSGKPALSVFVRAGQTADVKVPLGSYRIKYAAGSDWQGEKALFGGATQYFEADKQFDFVRKDGKAHGFEIELGMKPDGNLDQRPLDKKRW